MKRVTAVLIAVFIMAVSMVSASAAMDITSIDAPYGIVYKVYNDGVCERISVSCLFTDAYAALTSMTNEESSERYGATDIYTYVQIDYRVDGGEWHSNEVWDTTPTASEYGGQVPKGDTVRTFDLLYLVNESAVKNAGALAVKNDKGQTVFDLDNHTLEFRMRTSMGYTTSAPEIMTSEWSEIVKVERNKDFGKAPTELDAPKVSNPKIAYLENEMPYLAFDVMTPESIKEAEAWLSSQQPTYISMLVEIDRGTGTWESTNLSVSSSHYANETKGIYLNAADVEDVSKMKIRVNYVAYTEKETIYSDYSDVLEFDVPRWVDGKGIMHAKCKVCGICHPIFDQCMFVVGGVALLVIVIAAVPVKMHLDKVRAKKIAEEEEKQRKLEQERKAYDQAKKDKKSKNKKSGK
ncbi:MAG: hypothetical protein IJ261_06475 [Clostridia bacterium]|nr:hypothetical protein [Clostridia bacterium]